MEYLVSAEEMRRADHCVIEEYGVPSLVLMERAALASVELMEREGFDLSRVLVVSGSGNNGGDGFAMARILYLKGIEAELWFVGNPDHLSKEAALQKKICENYGMKFVRNLPAGEYTTIVDAVFGSGLSREVKGSYREVIESINRHPAKVFAVDIPSGISSDDGSVQGTAIRAAVTGALAFRKLGHVLYPGTEYAGRTFLLDIGITKEGFKGQFPRVQAPDRGFFSASHKESLRKQRNLRKSLSHGGQPEYGGSRLSFRKSGSHHGNWPGPGRDGRLQPGDSADTFSGGGSDHGGNALRRNAGKCALLGGCRRDWSRPFYRRSCGKRARLCANAGQNPAGAGCGCPEYFIKASGLVEKKAIRRKS